MNEIQTKTQKSNLVKITTYVSPLVHLKRDNYNKIIILTKYIIICCTSFQSNVTLPLCDILFKFPFSDCEPQSTTIIILGFIFCFIFDY